jgi:hypothetical protein
MEWLSILLQCCIKFTKTLQFVINIESWLMARYKWPEESVWSKQNLDDKTWRASINKVNSTSENIIVVTINLQLQLVIYKGYIFILLSYYVYVTVFYLALINHISKLYACIMDPSIRYKNIRSKVLYLFLTWNQL